MTKKGTKTKKAAKSKGAKSATTKPETPAAKGKRQPKQLSIPGTERKGIPEISEAAEELRSVRAGRMAMQKDEADKQSLLLGVMKTHGVTSYIYLDDENEEMKVELDDVVKVKVKKNKPDRGDE